MWLATSSKPLLFFIILSIKKGWVQKKTQCKPFYGFLIILFWNILFLKEFLACNGYFRLFTKIKKGSGNNFWYTFSAWFFIKKVLYLILYQLTRFQCCTFLPSQDIKKIHPVINFRGMLRPFKNVRELSCMSHNGYFCSFL